MSGYSYPPNESMGVMMGLSRAQLTAIATGLAVFVGSAMVDHLLVGVPLALLVVAVGAGQWAGTPFRSRIATHLGWVSSSKSRRYGVPVGGRRSGGEMPPCLRGYRLRPVEGVGAWASGAPLGLVIAHGLISMVMPVEGPQLALLGSDGIDGQLREWGDVLAGLCKERSDGGITRISWTDVHAAADSRTATAYHRTHGQAGPATGEYERHLESFANGTSDHRVFVTVTLSTTTARRRRSLATRSKADYVTATVEQCQSIARELGVRGYRVGRPLSPWDVAQLVRRLGDPWRPRRSELSGAERLGVPEADDQAPASIVNERLYVSVDSAIHRAYQVNWPSREVAGDWMWELLAAADGPKITTVVFQPIAPSASRRRVEHQLTRLQSDAQVEHRRKNRVSARRQAMAAAVQRREHELVAGHMEMEAFGLVVLAGRDLATLEERSERLERAAARCGGARLRPLDTMHDAGWAAALPIGMPVGRPST